MRGQTNSAATGVVKAGSFQIEVILLSLTAQDF
jgi:hypothetical protein